MLWAQFFDPVDDFRSGDIHGKCDRREEKRGACQLEHHSSMSKLPSGVANGNRAATDAGSGKPLLAPARTDPETGSMVWRNIPISLIDTRGGVLGNVRIATLDQATRAIQIDATLASVHLI